VFDCAANRLKMWFPARRGTKAIFESENQPIGILSMK
jgi:hypothetical protein